MAFSTGIGEHSGLTSPPEEILFVSETSPLQHVERQMRSSSGGDRLHQAIAVNNVSAPMSSYPIRPPHRPAAEPTEFTIETYNKLQVLEKKKLEYEYLKEQRRRFEAEMDVLDPQARLHDNLRDIDGLPEPVSNNFALNDLGPNSGYQQSAQFLQRDTYPPGQPADQNPPCNTLYVRNLPIDASENELKALFSKQRGFKRLVFRSKRTGPKCFVEFEDISFAARALNDLYGYPLYNSVKGGIRLSFSKNPLGVRTGQSKSMESTLFNPPATTAPITYPLPISPDPARSPVNPLASSIPPPPPPKIHHSPMRTGFSVDQPSAPQTHHQPAVSGPGGEFSALPSFSTATYPPSGISHLPEASIIDREKAPLKFGRNPTSRFETDVNNIASPIETQPLAKRRKFSPPGPPVTPESPGGSKSPTEKAPAKQPLAIEPNIDTESSPASRPSNDTPLPTKPPSTTDSLPKPLIMPKWPSVLTSQSTYVPPVFPSAPVPITPAPAASTHSWTSSAPRKTLTDQDRRRMCLYHEEHPTVKQTEIGAMFGVERSTVSKVLRQKEKYLYQDDGSRSPIKRSKGKFPDIERALANWARNHQRQGLPLSDTLIRDKAKFFANTVGNSESHLKANSTAWLEKFKQKNNLGNSERHDRANTKNGFENFKQENNLIGKESLIPEHYPHSTIKEQFYGQLHQHNIPFEEELDYLSAQLAGQQYAHQEQQVRASPTQLHADAYDNAQNAQIDAQALGQTQDHHGLDSPPSKTAQAQNASGSPSGTTAASIPFNLKETSPRNETVENVGISLNPDGLSYRYDDYYDELGMEKPKDRSAMSYHRADGTVRQRRVPELGVPQDERFSHQYTDSILEAESSIGVRRDECQSSTTGKTYSTRPTTVSDFKSSKPLLNTPAIVQNRIAEELELVLNGSEAIQDNLGDGQSTISADSVVVLTPSQRYVIIQEFCNALLKDLPSKCLQPHSQPLENPAFRQSFNGYLRDYSKEVMEGTAKRSRKRQASKAIRLLRNDILLRFQETLGGFGMSEKNRRITPSIALQAKDSGLREKTLEEKFSDWNVDGMSDCNDNLRLGPDTGPSDGFPEDISISSTEPNVDEGSMSHTAEGTSTITNPEDQGVYSYLVEHKAFSVLIQNLSRMVEQHFGNQMELIRHRVLLALRRPGIAEKASSGVFQISFRIEWDPVAFLKDQYPNSHLQPLRHVLALTGGAINAQLTTVEHYLRQTWPEHTYLLIDKISSIICQSGGVQLPLASDIDFSPDRRTVSVSGSENLIVTIAQQLAWLGAVCRVSVGQLAFCYTTMSEIDDSGGEFPGAVFSITYDVSLAGLEASESCWHNLVGNSVIAVGFPTPERTNGEIGLQVSLELMGALAKIPLATRFCGGYVLKGRSIMLVPVEKKGASVQWHLIRNRGGSRMHFRDLHRSCPNRLLFEAFDETDLSSADCFLGWCPDSANFLATKQYDYQSVGYSKTPFLSKRTLSIVGGSIGFQQLGTAGLSFSLGKKDGYYHNQAAAFYQDLLDDAAQIHIVLQDMEDRRAWLTDAETVILHIILHRHALKSFNGNSKMIYLQAATPEDPFSIRRAMISNADVVVREDKHMKQASVTSKLFKDLVGELYTLFEGLMATQEELAREVGLEVNFDRANHLHGWEYLDLVNRKLHPQPRRTQLKNTCGRWPKLMREINAVVLFGVRFHQAIQPTADARLCSRLKMLPKEKDYLAMEVTTLQKLYLESGSSEQQDLAQLTLSGTQLHRSKHLFEPCPGTSKRSSAREEVCTCDRVQQIVFKKGNTKITKLQGLGSSGAIIIGQGSANWIDGISKSISTAKSTLFSQNSRRTCQQEHAPLVKASTAHLEPAGQNDLEPIRLVSTENSASSIRSTEPSGSSVGSSMSTEPTSTTSSFFPARDYHCYDTTRSKPIVYLRQEHKQEFPSRNRQDQRQLQPEVIEELPFEKTPIPTYRESYNTSFNNFETPLIESPITCHIHRNDSQPFFENSTRPPLPSTVIMPPAQKSMPRINQARRTSLSPRDPSAVTSNSLPDVVREKPPLRRKPNLGQLPEV